jgi:RNA-splicing ligase RtcB
MPNRNHKKEAQMATSPAKQKSAMDTLLESMDELVDSAAKRMTAEELRKARKEINDVVDRAVVAHKRRRETA